MLYFFTFFCACCICFYLYLSSRCCTVCCRFLGCCRAISAPAWSLTWQSVYVSIKAPKNLQFYLTRCSFASLSNIWLSTFSRICEFLKLDFLMLPKYWGGKRQSNFWNHIRYHNPFWVSRFPINQTCFTLFSPCSVNIKTSGGKPSPSSQAPFVTDKPCKVRVTHQLTDSFGFPEALCRNC